MADDIKDPMAVENTNGDSSDYRSIFKATSLFGGVQVYQILIGIVKSKFIAVLLGPLGVGIMGLYQAALQFIQSLSSMGLSSSAVRDVSEAYGSGDNNRVAVVVYILRKLVIYTGLLGAIIVICFSSVLSKTSFGDSNHIVPFICLSVTLILDQIAAGQRVVLQGMRRLRDLAKASALGSTASLLVSIPLYYIIGIQAIVPTLILNSCTLLLLTWLYSRKVVLNKVSLSRNNVLKEGRGMVIMGLAISYSGILVYGCGYLLRWFIRDNSDTEMVGMYTAGFTIINTYVGMIFTAIGTDYYPRLAAVNSDNEKMATIVNQQGEIASMILAPLLQICLFFMPLMIRLLYSNEFLSANDFVVYSTVGMMFRLGSWLIAYQLIAKGDSKVYIISETVANLYSVLFSMLGFKLWGLTGLGVAFTLGYVLYFIQAYLIANKRYGYSMSKSFNKVFYFQLILLVIGFGVVRICNLTTAYFVGTALILFSVYMAIMGLNSKLGIWEVIRNKYLNK